MTVVPYIVSMATVMASVYLLNLLSNGDIELTGRGSGGLRGVYTVENYPQVILLLIAVVLFFLTIVIITNRLLTKFVFIKIMRPLEILADGVQHISEGNLDHRIEFSEQNEFKSICEAFNNMAERLKYANDTVKKNEQNRKELFTGISHDLRSPLTSIKAFVEGLLDGVANTPEVQREYLQVIKQKTEDINSMVSQLFLYSKIDMGNYPNKPEVLDIGKEIKDFVSASKEDYDAKGLSIKIVGLTSKINIHVDPLQLQSVFVNILENSAKYKNKDDVTVKITCLVDGDTVKITFEDNGPGVSDEALSKLFEAFYRVDPSRNNPNQGSGLGLAITSKALERMNGSISAEGVKDGGLCIIIKIPIYKGVPKNE